MTGVANAYGPGGIVSCTADHFSYYAATTLSPIDDGDAGDGGTGDGGKVLLVEVGATCTVDSGSRSDCTMTR